MGGKSDGDGRRVDGSVRLAEEGTSQSEFPCQRYSKLSNEDSRVESEQGPEDASSFLGVGGVQSEVNLVWISMLVGMTASDTYYHVEKC